MFVSTLNKLRRIVLSVAVGLIAALTIMPAQAAYAQAPGPCQLPDATFLGLPTWYKYLEGQEDPSRPVDGGYTCAPVIDDVDAILPIGLVILEGMLRMAGLVTVVMIFWASSKYLTSNGNGDAAAEARRTAINAIIGLAIIIIATATVSYIGNRLISPTQVVSSIDITKEIS